MFLMDDHTFDHFMKAQFLPKLLDRSRHDAWKQDGCTDLYRRCNTEARRVLSEHSVQPKPDRVLKEIERIVRAG